MQAPIYQVDAFASRAGEGNPAGVCLPPAPVSGAWMQDVAAEMNLSETAFLRPEDGAWGLRWFTPTVEVDLCGHATLAAAFVLWSEERSDPGAPLHFATRSGRLAARRGREGRVELDFPAEPALPAAPPAALLRALAPDGDAPEIVAAARNRVDWLLELADEEAVRALAPDMRALAAVEARGTIVTAPAGERARRQDPTADFVSRFFGPAVGVPEDPVTGSAHCALGPWWGNRLGRTLVTGRQVSARGGTVEVRMRGRRVTLAGRAVTVLRGTIDV
ncbi:MAG: PhzF family phenazine biosynthesis isomerase [Gemmatimonadota bacterium]|nr:PhzF family phenazine biosynthesis isomerase [Gemmatimonadota bacterium]